MPASPIVDYPEFTLNILPCYVQNVTLGNEDLVDLEIWVGETVTLPFEPFVQVPACNYTVEYTLTLLESSGDAIQFDEDLEGQSLFGSLDASARILKLAPDKGIYEAKTYGVFITAHIDVNKDVQEPLSVTYGPMMVNVLTEKVFN